MVRRRIRSKHLLDGLLAIREYYKLKAEVLLGTLWRACFERFCGAVLRQATERMKKCANFVPTISVVNLPTFLVLLFAHLAHMRYDLFNNTLKLISPL